MGGKEPIAVIQAKDDNVFEQGGSSGVGEKWLDSGYVLKVEIKGFPDGLDVPCERKPEQLKHVASPYTEMKKTGQKKF